ncbi:HpcH/HpaI aldolase/citrate lyase family protein [Qipengyuania sp. DSG2-2]|uniref:HpcH/HpaI aldolase/citrate lyase family protein n=1 Tax=Qipengyuania sp. DGS2-2 TaxID=3349631 RepID=UPI0036D247B6
MAIPMRSWLFAPGDSEKKMAKAAASETDIVIFDLEDAVASEVKPEARRMVAQALSGADNPERLWVRINPFESDMPLLDLAAVMPARPGGIVLPKAEGPQDIVRLDHTLSALEAAHGIELGSTPVMALVTETAASMFEAGNYAGAPRLVAMSWGAEDLSDSIGAQSNVDENGRFDPAYELARTLCLLGAARAGVTAIETIQTDFRDTEGLAKRAGAMRRQGFGGMLAIHPAQVDPINTAFTPGEDEIAEARMVVKLFDDNPGLGTIGHGGKMYDRPHLSRAQQLLASLPAD